MTDREPYKLAADLVPGDIVKHEGQAYQVLAAPTESALFTWLCRVELLDLATRKPLSVDYIATARVFLAGETE